MSELTIEAIREGLCRAFDQNGKGPRFVGVMVEDIPGRSDYECLKADPVFGPLVNEGMKEPDDER